MIEATRSAHTHTQTNTRPAQDITHIHTSHTPWGERDRQTDRETELERKRGN